MSVGSYQRGASNNSSGNSNNSNNNNNYDTTSSSVRLAGDNTKDRMYEPKHHQKAVRVLTVIAYIFFVSLAGIMLSLYYIFIYNPPPPTPSNINLLPINMSECRHGLNRTDPPPALETPRVMSLVNNDHGRNKEHGRKDDVDDILSTVLMSTTESSNMIVYYENESGENGSDNNNITSNNNLTKDNVNYSNNNNDNDGYNRNTNIDYYK